MVQFFFQSLSRQIFQFHSVFAILTSVQFHAGTFKYFSQLLIPFRKIRHMLLSFFIAGSFAHNAFLIFRLFQNISTNRQLSASFIGIFGKNYSFFSIRFFIPKYHHIRITKYREQAILDNSVKSFGFVKKSIALSFKVFQVIPEFSHFRQILIGINGHRQTIIRIGVIKLLLCKACCFGHSFQFRPGKRPWHPVICKAFYAIKISLTVFLCTSCKKTQSQSVITCSYQFPLRA